VSTQVEIKAVYDREKQIYRKITLKYHPDKNLGNPDAAEKFLEVRHRWNEVELAYDVLGNEIGFYLDRWNYDKDGEALRLAFRKAFDSTNNGQTFKEHADYLRAKEQRRERYERKTKTTKDREKGDQDGKFVAVSNCLFVLS
jgi:DnaJ-class molecular chaperone